MRMRWPLGIGAACGAAIPGAAEIISPVFSIMVLTAFTVWTCTGIMIGFSAWMILDYRARRRSGLLFPAPRAHP
jgi:hypothetical protein